MAKKKEKPEACGCRKCGRTPVVLRIRGSHWRVACPYLDCIQNDAIGETETEAIERWNAENEEEVKV